MTIPITPALTAEEWARVRNVPTSVSADAGKILFMGHRVHGIPGVPVLVVEPNEDIAPLIALANAALPDDDPRKITRKHINFLVDLGWRIDGTLGKGTGYDPDALTLWLIADLLASYLPPEGT